MELLIPGFLPEPKLSADGSIYRGRLVCPGVQWTGLGENPFATFTMTAEEIAGAAESQLLWTDQDVQRGIQPGLPKAPPQELPVGAGYPDPARYVFDVSKADQIAEKLLAGERLFLSPFIWNLRPGQFGAHWSNEEAALFLYSGRIYLPDSHHRHQGLLKAVRAWREAPGDYPSFSGARQFKVELYFLSREGEGDYFFEKNQLPKPTAKSKAYDLTTKDDLSILAKRFISLSTALDGNVNRVTDRLTARNAQVATLSTIREMMRGFAGTDVIDATELEGLATVAARFYDMLAGVRPELGKLTVAERRNDRDQSLASQAVMMHGYAALMREYNAALAKEGSRKADREWADRLRRLEPGRSYRYGRWDGEFFSKSNPLWQAVGIVNKKQGGRLTVLNTGAARKESRRVLVKLLEATSDRQDLTSLSKR